MMNTSKNIINKLTLLLLQECNEEIFQFINGDENARNSLLEIEKLVNVNHAHTTGTFKEEFFVALNETELDTLIKIFTLLDGQITEFTLDSKTPVPMLLHRLEDLNYSHFDKLVDWVFKKRTNKHIFPFGWNRHDEANSLIKYQLLVEKDKLKSEIYRIQNSIRSVEKRLLNPNKLTDDLKDAIKRNDLRSIKRLISKGADVNFKVRDDTTLEEKVNENMAENKNARGSSAQFFVAGELCRRNLVAVVTMGNTPNTDILCSNTEGTKFVHIQVKTFVPGIRSVMVGKKAEKDFGKSFIWVLAGIPKSESEDDFLYYIVPSSVMAKNVIEQTQIWLNTPGRNGRAHKPSDARSIFLPPKENLNGWNLEKYKNNWELIESKLR